MLFKTEFKIVEIRENGVIVTHFLRGTKRNVNKDIEMFKKESKRYEMFGDGMTIWV